MSVSEAAVIGPPWHAVGQGVAESLLASEGADLIAPAAWAAACPATGMLVRAPGPRMAGIRARLLAAGGDGTALVLKGAARLTGGRWLWPVVSERVRLEKVLDPRLESDFLVIVENAHQQMLAAASGPEQDALRALVPGISGADWAALTEAEASAVIDGIAADLSLIASDPRMQEAYAALGAHTQAVSAATARSLRIRGVAHPLSTRDLELANRIGSRQGGVLLTDEYGRRALSFERGAAGFIGTAAGDGAGSAEIAKELTRLLGGAISGRSDWYFQVVANAATSRARSFGEVTSMNEAGITEYEWEAVLDERTSTICEFLHGHRWPVADAVRRFAAADAEVDAEAEIGHFPWYSTVGDRILAGARGSAVDQRVTVAQVLPGGGFRTVTEPALSPGTPTPPAHGNCRSLLLPVF